MMFRLRFWTVLILLSYLAGCVPEQQKELKPGEKAIILTGTVFPFQDAEVMSPIWSTVNKILVEPGAKVEEGDALLLLDQTAATADVARAEAAFATARARLAEARASAWKAEVAGAQADVERSKQELEREKKLANFSPVTTDYERSGIILENAKARLERMYALLARRLVSRPEVEAAENEYAEAWRRFEVSKNTLERKTALRGSDLKIAEARYRGARARLAALQARESLEREKVPTALAQVRQAEADLAKARYNLEQTSIKAPISGVVTEIMTEAGHKVFERKSLVKIVDINRVRVKADLSPGLLPFIEIGQEAMVTVNTVPPTDVSSKVDQIQSVADQKTQALAVTFIISNPEFKFQPGFTARVEIPVERGLPKQNS
jgi:multidrug resistance efflux pump